MDKVQFEMGLDCACWENTVQLGGLFNNRQMAIMMWDSRRAWFAYPAADSVQRYAAIDAAIDAANDVANDTANDTANDAANDAAIYTVISVSISSHTSRAMKLSRKSGIWNYFSFLFRICSFWEKSSWSRAKTNSKAVPRQS